jgi:sugar lactone lactonase YvrE
VSPGGEIRRCPIGGCGGSPSVLLSQADLPSGILLIGSRIVWAERSGGIVVGADITDGGNRHLFYQPDDSGLSTEPYQLASDPSYLYFTDIRTGFTRRAPFDGGGVVTLANNSVTNADGIAVSATDVYFTGGGSADGILWKIAKTSFVQNGTANAFASPLKNPNGVAIDDNYVYWVNAGTTSDTGDGSVMACPLSSSTCANPIVLATSQHNPNRITVDRDAVYWANNGASTGRDGSIWKVAKP